ncbi:MAG TPA: hypothetical protein VK578_21845 [Edaphobacter sp.]|nr:hypothetical protein [Edaphobacter sp.]
MKLWLAPPKIVDPVFGKLTFMHISKHPERSYWEGEWKLPGSDYSVEVFLRGGEDGPREDSRNFYVNLPNRIQQILEQCRSPLAKVFREWLNREMPKDIFSELKLASFGVDDPDGRPLLWSVSFETTGEKWLGITIPFVDDVAGDAEIDT